MEIKVNILKVENLSKSDHGELYLNTYTDLGRLVLPIKKLLEHSTYKELYGFNGVIKAFARYFRGKNRKDLIRAELECLDNMPDEAKPIFDDYTGAAVITECLGIPFKEFYDKACVCFREETFNVISEDIQWQLEVYKKLVEVENSKLMKTKRGYLEYVQRALAFFDDDVKLLKEVKDD